MILMILFHLDLMKTMKYFLDAANLNTSYLYQYFSTGQ